MDTGNCKKEEAPKETLVRILLAGGTDGGEQAARRPPGLTVTGIKHQATGKRFALGLHHYH